MDKQKISEVIDLLARLTKIDDVQKKGLVEKYSAMSELEVIKDLSMISYRVFSDKEDYYDYALNVIHNINPKICPPVEDMKIMLHKMHTNEVDGNMSMEENHELVNETLDKVTKVFNLLDIDYYIVGALPCFLKSGVPMFRYHDDIDIMVNEADMDKVADAIKRIGYDLHDDRFPSLSRFEEMQQNKPPHTVLAQNRKNEFHIGFFTFKREKDNSITMREYEHRLEDGKVVTDVLERRSTPLGTSLRYDEREVSYGDTHFKTGTTENVYHLKCFTKRPKDITDMQKLEPYIDVELLKKLEENPLENVVVNNVDPLTSGVKNK